MDYEELPYIVYESIFETYVDTLLSEPESRKRNYELVKAFNFIEKLINEGEVELANMAYISLLEWRSGWFYRKTYKFLGTSSIAELDKYFPEWRETMEQNGEEDKEEIIDVYGIKSIVSSLLRDFSHSKS